MFKIDCFAYSNRLSSVHPVEKLIFAVTTMFLCLFLNTPVVSLVTILIMTVATIYMAGIRVKFYLELLTLPFWFLLVGVIAIVVDVRVWNFYIGIDRQGFFIALNLFLKVMGSLSCLYFLILTTPVNEILYVLKKLKLPAILLELMGTIYRFLFVLLEIAGRIHLSQSSRWGYVTFRNSCRSLGILVWNLFIKSLRRSKLTYYACLSRGYTGEIKLLEDPTLKICWSNIVKIAAIEVLLIVVGLNGRGII